MILEGLKQDIWDSVTFAASSQAQGVIKYLFRNQKGVSSITLLDTNITSAQKIPYKKAVVYGVNCYICREANVDVLPGLDLNAALHNLSIRITKNGITKVFAMAYMIPAGCGVSGSIETGVATTTILNYNNAAPVRSNFFPLKNPETFTDTDTLDGEVKVESAWTPATALQVKVTLLAYVERDLT